MRRTIWNLDGLNHVLLPFINQILFLNYGFMPVKVCFYPVTRFQRLCRFTQSTQFYHLKLSYHSMNQLCILIVVSRQSLVYICICIMAILTILCKRFVSDSQYIYGCDLDIISLHCSSGTINITDAYYGQYTGKNVIFI